MQEDMSMVVLMKNEEPILYSPKILDEGPCEERKNTFCIPQDLLVRCRSEPLRVYLYSRLWMAHSNGSDPHEP